MKNFAVFLVLLLSSSILVSSSPTSNKEHKKKLLDKLRAALTTNESSEGSSVEVGSSLRSETLVEKVDEVVTPLLEKDVGGAVVQDEIGEVTLPENEKVETVEVEPTTNTYMGMVDTYSNLRLLNNYFINPTARFRTIFKRVLEMLGLRRRKDGRQSRLLSYDRSDNDLDRVPVYQEEVRTTVGAVLGRKECIQKAACVSGTYLKGVKGKQIIFA